MRRVGGFTLVEAVVTILIAAIMAVGIVSYIGDSVAGFSAAGNRNKLASSGRTVVDRMTLELHNALPNSIRVSAAAPNGNQCLEFIPARWVTAYLEAPVPGTPADEFRIVMIDRDEQGAGLELPSPAEVYAAVYPHDTDDIYNHENLGNRATVTLIDSILNAEDEAQQPISGLQVVTLGNVNHQFPRRSPSRRLFIADEPVSFCLVNDRIYRYSDYGFNPDQCTPDACLHTALPSSAPGRALVTDRLDNTGLTAFRYSPPELRRNALISLDLNFSDQGDNVRLTHEIVTQNVP